MYDLWFDDPIFHLLWSQSDPSANGVVRSAIYQPGNGEGAQVTDRITLALDGSQADIENFVRGVEGVLRACEAGQAEALPGGAQAQQWMQSHLLYRAGPGAAIWRSLVLGGWLEHGASGLDPRQHGGQMINLHVRRVNFWEERAARQNPLAGPGGRSGTLGGWVTVSNHSDDHTGHRNACWDDISDPGLPVVTEPYPAVLSLQAGDPTNTRPLTIYAGHHCRYGSQPADMQIQAEDGAARSSASGAVIASQSCSGGQYLHLSWNGDAEIELWQGDLANGQSLLGLPYRLMVRLASGLETAEPVWCRWRIYALDASGEHLLNESEGMYLENHSECLPGPVLDLPPWPVTAELGSLTLRFVMTVRAGGSGPHALPLDFVMLLPLEGWRVYRPLNQQRTLELVDDGARGALRSALGLRSHSLEGPGIDLRWSTMGSGYVFIVVRHEIDGSRTWPIDLGLRVKLEYRARKRLL